MSATTANAGIPNSQVSMPLGSMFASWQDATTDAGALTQDASGIITNPNTQLVTAASKVILRRANQAGFRLQLRFAYTTAATGVTAPTVELFARNGPSGLWERRRNVNGDDRVSLAIDTTYDVRDGTLSYTTVNELTQMWRLNSNDDFIVGIAVAAAGTGLTVAKIQAKVVD